MIGLILAGISAAAAVGGAVESEISSEDALSEQQQMLKTRELQNEYQTLVRKNQTADQVQLALQRNEVATVSKGESLASPSYFAQQSNVVKEGDRAMKNAQDAQSLNDFAAEMEANAARQRINAARVENAVNTAGSLAQDGLSTYRYHYSALAGLETYKDTL